MAGPRPGNGGARPGGGRPKGSLGKRTLARYAQASKQIDEAREGKVELGREVLERMMKIAEGATGLHRPVTTAEMRAGREQNPDGDWDRFGAWFDRTVYCAKELAKFQSPTFKAVAVSMTPGEMGGQKAPKQIEGKVIDINDAHVVTRTYLTMVKAGKEA